MALSCFRMAGLPCKDGCSHDGQHCLRDAMGQFDDKSALAYSGEALTISDLRAQIKTLTFKCETLEGNLANAQAGLAAAWDDGCLTALKTRDDYENLYIEAWTKQNPYRPSETPEPLS